ncbi:MAG: ArsA family ATPase [Marinifilaceae bacterium]
MSLTGLQNKELQMILFGGKGGVGKTCCALASALFLAKDYKTLVLSTDPAHSLSDCLDQSIGNQITPVYGIPNLSAIEINAQKVYEEFKAENQGELKRWFDSSTNLDEEDIGDLLSLPIPGIDEVMSFKSIVDFVKEGRFDKYIVDTAPTGHAMRLITSPHLLNNWIKTAAKMRWKYRYMVDSFSGSYSPDETDDLLLKLKRTVTGVEKLLRDPQKSQFIPVCIPESMSVMETNRMIAELGKYNIPIKQLVVNNIYHSEGCNFCREKKSDQSKYLEQIEKEHKGRTITYVSKLPGEVKGIDRLSTLKSFIIN